MTVQITGDTPSFTVGPTAGNGATLYRFELLKGALIRAKLDDVDPRADRKRHFIDVLLNEDETRLYLSSVCGFIVPRQGGRVGAQRTFKVGSHLKLAISKALSVGPNMRHPLRLTTLDGQLVN